MNSNAVEAKRLTDIVKDYTDMAYGYSQEATQDLPLQNALNLGAIATGIHALCLFELAKTEDAATQVSDVKIDANSPSGVSGGF